MAKDFHNFLIKLLLIFLFLINFVSSSNFSISCPSEIEFNKEFRCIIFAANISKSYDIKIDFINSNGKRMSSIMNNGKWESTYNFVSGAISSDGDFSFLLIINKEKDESAFGSLRIRESGKSTSYLVSSFNISLKDSAQNNLLDNKTNELNLSENYDKKENQQTSNNQQFEDQQRISQNKINLNNATLSELIKITGVGEKTAQEIINSRPFCSLDDLLKVKGIGEKTLEKIKEQGIAYVEENSCKTELKEEKIILNNKEENNKKIGQEESKKESIINLNSNKEETKNTLTTGKVIYESKTEKIRKYAIYLFSALLVVILFLLLKD